MEPGTKFCMDHPDIKIPIFADECPICNKPLIRYGHTYPGGSFQTDEVKALDPQEEEIVMESLAELYEPESPTLILSTPPDFEGAGPDPADHSQEETFKALHERITTKIEEKKKARNGRTRT